MATIFMTIACSPHDVDPLAMNASSGSFHRTAVKATTSVDTTTRVPIVDQARDANIVILKDILTKVGRFDGKPVTDFEQSARYVSTFTTAAGARSIDWAKVGNWAPHEQDGRTVLDIDDGGGSHAISVPTTKQSEPLGDAAGDLESGFVVNSERCTKK